MNNLDVMFWKPLEKFKEVNWFRWRVPFRMIRIPTVNNSSIKRDRERSASFHITIVTKKHQNFFYLKKILPYFHTPPGVKEEEKTNCGFTQLCKQTKAGDARGALNNFLGMRNVVYCFTVLWWMLLHFWRLCLNTAQKGNTEVKIFWRQFWIF